MRTKTSVSLSEDLLAAIEKIAGRGVNRSEFLEQAGWDRVALLRRRQRDARDRRLIDEHADSLNREALDVLEYQIEP
jgi:metal-responsive CopG/Arc/MetJ family transcriptional regulator